MRQKILRRIRMISLVYFLSLLLLTTVAVASDLPGKFGGTFQVATEEEVGNWDIHRTTAITTRRIVHHFMEGLFTLNKDFKPVPMLVDTYTTNPEKTVYTFKLRKGILFHNGKELNSEDVVASLNRWGQYGPTGTSVYKFVKSVEAVDRYTVRINLKGTCGMLLSGLASHRQGSFIYPKEVVENVGKGILKPEPDQMVGTGPYKFVEFKPDRYAKMVRFDKYKPRTEPPSGYSGRKTAYFDEILFIPVRDPTVRAASLETGEVDFAMGLFLRDYDRLDKNPDITTILGPPWYPCIVFNMKKGLLKENFKVRKAIQTALDIEAIMKAAVGIPRFYRLDPSVMWKETNFWTDWGKPYYNLHDVEKAKRLVEESGYKGETIRWITTRDYPVLYDASVATVTQLRKIGLKIDHRVVDWATVVKIRKNPDEWDSLLIQASYRTEPTFIVLQAPDWINHWADPEKDALRDKFMSEPDPDKRYKLWVEIEKIFYKKAPWVKLGDFFILDGRRSYVKGFTPFPENFYWNTWFEKK